MSLNLTNVTFTIKPIIGETIHLYIWIGLPQLLLRRRNYTLLLRQKNKYHACKKQPNNVLSYSGPCCKSPASSWNLPDTVLPIDPQIITNIVTWKYFVPCIMPAWNTTTQKSIRNTNVLHQVASIDVNFMALDFGLPRSSRLLLTRLKKG